MPGTVTASAAFCAATTARVHPAAAAASRAGRTPGTGRRLPSRPSPATNTHPSPAAGTVPAAVSTATAIARSKPLPCLGRLTGSRLTVMARPGQGCALLRIAARIRSRVSRALVSGRPERLTSGGPLLMRALTWTRWPSTPITAAPWACPVPGAGKDGDD